MNKTYSYCATCGKLLPVAIKNGYIPTGIPLLSVFDITLTTSDRTVAYGGQGFIGVPSRCQCSDVPQAFYDAFKDAEKL